MFSLGKTLLCTTFFRHERTISAFPGLISPSPHPWFPGVLAEALLGLNAILCQMPFSFLNEHYNWKLRVNEPE